MTPWWMNWRGKISPTSPFFPLGGFNPLQSSTLQEAGGRPAGRRPCRSPLAWLLQRAPHILLIPGTSLGRASAREHPGPPHWNCPPELVTKLDCIGGPGRPRLQPHTERTAVRDFRFACRNAALIHQTLHFSETTGHRRTLFAPTGKSSTCSENPRHCLGFTGLHAANRGPRRGRRIRDCRRHRRSGLLSTRARPSRLGSYTRVALDKVIPPASREIAPCSRSSRLIDPHKSPATGKQFVQRWHW